MDELNTLYDDPKIKEYMETFSDGKESKNTELKKKALSYSNSVAKVYIAKVEEEQKKIRSELKLGYNANVKKLKADGAARILAATTPEDKKTATYELKSALFDAKNQYETKIDRSKDVCTQAFTDHIQINRVIRNQKANILEDVQLKWKNYVNNFKATKFLLDNGLYLAILVFFIVCVIVAPAIGAGNLLTLPNIFTILEQSSTRMFYALGVAGLILLAGTDLSVGRMVAMGSVVTGLILHPGTNIVKFFNMGPWNFTGMPMGLRLALALFLSILLCTTFSAFAGLFTAKLKIHPFVSTLATQLIIYGL